MPQSKSKPSAPNKPKLEINPAKDLEPDDSENESVRGGGAAVMQKGKIFSDASLKNQVTPLRDALVRLHALRF